MKWVSELRVCVCVCVWECVYVGDSMSYWEDESK